jgi:hypothetical protein
MLARRADPYVLKTFVQPVTHLAVKSLEEHIMLKPHALMNIRGTSSNKRGSVLARK